MQEIMPARSKTKPSLKAIPLPGLKDLLRALTAREYRAGGPPHRWPSNAYLYNLARWAIHDAVGCLAGKESSILYLPAYICTETIEPFRGGPLSLRFYPLDDTLNPDWDWLSHSRPLPGDVLLLVHYFGLAADGAAARSFCERHNIALVEDAAHFPGPGPGVGEYGQAAVYSIRKTLPLPDGGVLTLAKGGLDSPPASLPYGRQAVGSGIWCLKRLIQRYLWDPPRVPVALRQDDSPGRAGMSGLSRRLWAHYASSLDRIIALRRRNYALLKEAMDGLEGLAPLWPSTLEPARPYVFPLLVDRRRDSLLAGLRGRGVPAGVWPELPPEVAGLAAGEAARNLNQRIMILPVHQNLSMVEMEWMARQVRDACRTLVY